ncbi:MAG: VOC family protein [Phenylobacterium sp.]|uniref:VOC family protein n=1 Tax=Phenylobacterium sp. TaxID=1871053 RepID=UPI002732370F|nr:VOC family protein [Phenylobacterium sp.]MDP3749191.1 VOC family protein [Phenylobacterium sp.]
MTATLRHFAINADDVPRARAFYENAFGWTFTPWGPPGFYQTRSAGPGFVGALQGRRDIAGHVMPSVELTFGVEDVEAMTAAIEAAGGKVIMPLFHIETVGHLAFFQDTEGNVAGVMQYERDATPEGAPAMPGVAQLRHVSINADDVGRARAFYERVFGWTFTPWGPPDFFQLHGAGIGGALQARHQVEGRTLPGLAVSFGVPDIEAAAAGIPAAGGAVLSAPFHIVGVGHHIFFQDSEANLFAAMQYERNDQ